MVAGTRRGAGAEAIAFLQDLARPDGHDNIEYVAVHERLRGQGYGRRGESDERSLSGRVRPPWTKT